MVVVGDKKYACASCIKGHRAASCAHPTRALYEVKRKGRPQTQCPDCRNRRIRNRYHVRCDCLKPDSEEGNRGEEGEVRMFVKGLEDVERGKSVWAAYPIERRPKRVRNPCACGEDCTCGSHAPSSSRAGKKPRLVSPSPEPEISPEVAPEPQRAHWSPESEDPPSSADGAEDEPAEVVDFCCGPGCSCREHAAGSQHAAGHTISDSASPVVPSPVGPTTSTNAAIKPEIEERSASTPSRPSRSPTIPISPPPAPCQPARITLPSIHSFPWSSPPPVARPLPQPQPIILLRPVGIARCACGWSCVCPGCAEHSPATAVYSVQTCPEFCTTCTGCGCPPGTTSTTAALRHTNPATLVTVNHTGPHDGTSYGTSDGTRTRLISPTARQMMSIHSLCDTSCGDGPEQGRTPQRRVLAYP